MNSDTTWARSMEACLNLLRWVPAPGSDRYEFRLACDRCPSGSLPPWPGSWTPNKFSGPRQAAVRRAKCAPGLRAIPYHSGSSYHLHDAAPALVAFGLPCHDQVLQVALPCLASGPEHTGAKEALGFRMGEHNSSFAGVIV